MHIFVAHPGWRVERVAAGESAPEWAGALESFDESAAEVLKKDGGTAVFRATLLGREVVLKRWDMAGPGSRLRALVRSGRADRHWRNAAWLMAQGFVTARCFALATEYRRPCPRRWLVMEHIPGRTVLQHLSDGDLGVRDEHSVGWLLGRQIAAFEGCFRFNRDHKPSNLIVTGDDEGTQIAIIDCVAIQGGYEPDRMLASLLIEPTGCGLTVRSALAMRVLKSYIAQWAEDRASHDDTPASLRELRNDLWRRVARRIRAHGDPRPRVDPLARVEPRR